MVWGATFSREGKTRVLRGLRGGSDGGGGSLTSAGGIRRGFKRKGGVTRWPRQPAK